MPEAGCRLNRDPRRFVREGYCVSPPVFNDPGLAANRRLFDEATDAGTLGRPGYRRCSHAVEAVLGPNLILVFSRSFITPPR